MNRIIVSLAILTLTACGSAEDTVYEAFKCAKVAIQFGEDKKADQAMFYVRNEMKEIEESGVNVGRFMGQLSMRYTDDLELYKYSLRNQRAVLQEVYESSECQDLYTVD